MDFRLAEEHFHISDKGSDNPIFSVPAAELLERDTMREFLRLIKEAVRGIGFELALSDAGLSFFGLAATKQYAMSLYDRVVDLSLSNLTIQLESHGDHTHVVFKVGEWRWTDLPAAGRETAVAAEWNDYFAGTMNPLIEAAASAVDLKPDLIWNQYGTRILYMMQFLQGLLPAGPVVRRFEADFALLRELPASTFNRRRKNPYDHTPKWIENPLNTEEKWMIRSACCMYYRKEDSRKCYTCPILKEEAREARKLEMIAEHEPEQASV